MHPLRIDGRQHLVKETSLARYLRRDLRDPNIFTYWHIRKRCWVAATWLSKSGGCCVEHGNVQDLRDGCAVRGLIDSMRSQRSPMAREDAKKWAEQVRRGDLEDCEQRQAEADYHRDIVEFVRKRSNHVVRDHPHWCMF